MTRFLSAFVVIVVVTLLADSVSGREISFPGSFSKILPKHPRLFLTKQREAEIHEQVQTDEFLRHLVEELIKKADEAKRDQPTEYHIPDGLRLLRQSQRSLERTSVLAFAYRMTSEKEYADKAVEEMLAVCRFKDWNPRHYLDTAEMATAVGIGYDWLYDFMTSEQKKEICDAMLKHALKTGHAIYDKKDGWAKSISNWNEVCNAGLTVGALAVADEEPEIAETIVKYAIESIPYGILAYKPDGAYPEGPMYWNYGASFTGLMLKALNDVFQSDFGLLKSTGLSVTGDYYMGVIGPNFTNYNYADCVERAESSPMMFALATFYNRPDYTVWLRTFLKKENRFKKGRLAVFHAVWYDPKGTERNVVKAPLAAKYRGIQDICTMRTAWNDPMAAFLGFKAGNNRAGHGHLDIGSFVYEINGIRWAVDLGTDNYNLPGYFGKQRWEYFRMNNHSHNTWVIGDKLQNQTADCKLVEFELGNDGKTIARAVADMTDAYKGQVISARRSVTLLADGCAVIEDELDGVTETLRWAFATLASIELDGKKATLSQNGRKVLVRLDSDQVGVFQTFPAKPPTEKENQNTSVSILATFTDPQSGKIIIRVIMQQIDAPNN